jgi:hypothetical protein
LTDLNDHFPIFTEITKAENIKPISISKKGNLTIKTKKNLKQNLME